MDRQLLILLGCRLLQFLFAAVVLGVSVQLATRLKNFDNACDAIYGEKVCKLYGLIPAIRYCAFVGVFGIIDLLAGAASLFLDMIPYLVVLGFDGLATVFYLAGGVVSAPYMHMLRETSEADAVNRESLFFSRTISVRTEAIKKQCA